MLPRAPHLHRAGFHSLFLDVRSHGQSDRRRFVSRPRFADDLDVALAWPSGRRETSTVGVVGHSVGGGAAILTASRGGPHQALVSVAAPTDPAALMRQQMASAPRPVRAAALGVIKRAIGQLFEGDTSRPATPINSSNPSNTRRARRPVSPRCPETMPSTGRYENSAGSKSSTAPTPWPSSPVSP